MDIGAWWATVHGVTEVSRHDLVTKQQQLVTVRPIHCGREPHVSQRAEITGGHLEGWLPHILCEKEGKDTGLWL